MSETRLTLPAHLSRGLRPLRTALLSLLGLIRWRADGLVILYCHDVGTRSHPMCIPAPVFEARVRDLAADGWKVVPLSEALKLWDERRAADSRVIALCFDDGFAGVHRFALPVLEQYGFRATVFVCTGFLGGTPSWPGLEPYTQGARAQRGDVRLLSEAEVADLHRKGWEIAAHSVTHPDLTKLAEARTRAEIDGSRRTLQELLNVPATSFCYPYGAVDREVVRLARASGITSACGIETGHVRRTTDRMLLPRLHLDADVDRVMLRAMLSSLFPAYLKLSAALKEK